jgi:hypothetical protein
VGVPPRLADRQYEHIDPLFRDSRSAGGAAARHDVIVAIEALARDDGQQSHRCQESAPRARRSGTPRRPRSNATARTANQPPCRCRGLLSATATGPRAATHPTPRLERSAHRRPHDRFCASVRAQLASAIVLRASRAETESRDPNATRERSSASGPGLMSRGGCRRRSRQPRLARSGGKTSAEPGAASSVTVPKPPTRARRVFGRSGLDYRGVRKDGRAGWRSVGSLGKESIG